MILSGSTIFTSPPTLTSSRHPRLCCLFDAHPLCAHRSQLITNGIAESLTPYCWPAQRSDTHPKCWPFLSDGANDGRSPHDMVTHIWTEFFPTNFRPTCATLKGMSLLCDRVRGIGGIARFGVHHHAIDEEVHVTVKKSKMCCIFLWNREDKYNVIVSLKV